MLLDRHHQSLWHQVGRVGLEDQEDLVEQGGNMARIEDMAWEDKASGGKDVAVVVGKVVEGNEN